MIGVIVMSNRALPTVDEIVNSLKRSYLPTILIEGSDDVFIYRWLKKSLDANLVSLQACGGRGPLLEIYDRRDEFAGKNVVFVADKDSYRFDGVPQNREGVIFTSGYCIENDIFEGSGIYSFVDEEDKDRHDLLRKIIGYWFAFELKKYKSSGDAEVTLSVASHINEVSPIGLDDICPSFSEKISYLLPAENEIEEVMCAYNLNVRGKQLFQMLSRFLSKKGRFSSFSEKNLVEIALKQGNNEFINKLISDINIKLDVA
jgi:hypothetical protein